MIRSQKILGQIQVHAAGNGQFLRAANSRRKTIRTFYLNSQYLILGFQGRLASTLGAGQKMYILFILSPHGAIYFLTWQVKKIKSYRGTVLKQLYFNAISSSSTG